jgi:hypothetical protein
MNIKFEKDSFLLGHDLIRMATVDGKRFRCIAHWKTIDALPEFARLTRSGLDKEIKNISTILRPHFERKIQQAFPLAMATTEIYLTPEDLRQA